MFLIFMIIRAFDQLMMSQIGNNPIHSPRQDPIVWIIQWTRIPDFLTSNIVSIIYDILMISIPIFIIMRLLRNKSIHRLSTLHFGLFFIYILSIYCFPTLSIRKYLGLLLTPIAFIFQDEKRYARYMELLRFYICFIFSSASIWKIARGVITDTDHMMLTLKQQHIDNILNWNDHIITKLAIYLVSNPMICHYLLLAAIFSQLLFLIGFITKKYDWLLAILLIVFIIMDFLIMRIEYWEFLIFLPILLNIYLFKNTNQKRSILRSNMRIL